MRNKLSMHRPIFMFFCFAIFFTACKSTKPATQISMDELYKTWSVDSVYMEGNFLPNSELLGGSIEFTKDKKLISKTGKRVNNITFDLIDNKIVNVDKPTDPSLTIEQLSKEQLILKSENGGITKLRMILSPLKY